jgi:hypothetical protein
MGRDLLLVPRGTPLSGETHIFVEYVGKSHAGHGTTVGTQEHVWNGVVTAHRQPCLESVGGLSPPGQGTCSASCALDLDHRRGLERQGGAREGETLRNPETRGKTQRHHGPIPEASAGMDLGCVPQRLPLGHRKIMDQRLSGLLLGDRQPPAALFEARRDAIFDEAHQGFDGRQARVAGTGAMAPLGLQMREKIHPQLGLERLQTQGRRGQSQPRAGAGAQPLQGLGVARPGMVPGAARQRQTLA